MSDHDSDPPPIRRSTPPFGTLIGPIQELEDRVDQLAIKVDRLVQANKILRWAAITALTAALGAVGAAGKMLYGMGVDDQSTKYGIERAQRQADENKADVRELQRFVYRRFGADMRSTHSKDKDDQP